VSQHKEPQTSIGARGQPAFSEAVNG